MVSPLLRSTSSLEAGASLSPGDLAKPILELLPRLHVIVIGPGLGRDHVTLMQVSAIIKAARAHDPPVPLVMDADCLFLIQQEPDLVKGYKDCILTPNVMEFARLAKAMNVDVEVKESEKVCQKLANAMGGVCIIQKGKNDYISNGEETTVSDFKGGLKRSGGQGDTLTGSLGTFLAWRQIYHEGLWDVGKEPMSRHETLMVCAFAGSAITRECSRRAFAKKGRSLQASDLTDEVHGSFLSIVGEPDSPDMDSDHSKL